jgi:hypothetical protein
MVIREAGAVIRVMSVYPDVDTVETVQTSWRPDPQKTPVVLENAFSGVIGEIAGEAAETQGLGGFFRTGRSERGFPAAAGEHHRGAQQNKKKKDGFKGNSHGNPVRTGILLHQPD